jgi:two-component system alkaline phosphatase synthesis response regulator PhoP
MTNAFISNFMECAPMMPNTTDSAKTPSAHILVVDDEVLNRHAISKNLQKVGYLVSEAGSADEAVEMLRYNSYDVVLTDVKMPGSMDGMGLLRFIRAESSEAVVILMTAYSEVPLVVEALKLGANDYFMKPGSMHDLRNAVARGVDRARSLRRRKALLDTIRDEIYELALADGERAAAVGAGAPARAGSGGVGGGRWAEPEAPVASVQIGALTVYPGRYQITAGDQTVDLTPTEFDLLMYLGAHSGRVVPCHELVREVRTYTVDEAEAREVIRPHISNLRRKLKASGQNPDLIVNVRGLGYRLNDRAR